MFMKLKGFVIGFVAMVLATLPGNALAVKLIDEELLYYYGQNGIYHYNGSAEKCGPSDGGNGDYNSLGFGHEKYAKRQANRNYIAI